MKRIQKISLFVGTMAIGMLMALGPAQAQVTSTGVGSGAVDITLSGDIASSLLLTVDTQTGTVLSATTVNAMPTASAATVNFGSFSTQSAALTNGKIVRTTSGGTAGAFAVAQMTAAVLYSGNTTPGASANINLTLGAPGGTSPIAANNTRVQVGATPTWTNSTIGTPIVATDTSICPNSNPAAGNCASGTAYNHDLAVFIPDSQKAGDFTQVVHYTATSY
jgi:hypothetical protein